LHFKLAQGLQKACCRQTVLLQSKNVSELSKFVVKVSCTLKLGQGLRYPYCRQTVILQQKNGAELTKFLSHVRYNFTKKTGTGFTKFLLMAKCTFTNHKRGQGLRNSWCRSTLETLAQLHGTGLAFKKSVGGHKEILKLFPALEEQIQVKVHTYSP
jgi:hypothetical protein